MNVEIFAVKTWIYLSAFSTIALNNLNKWKETHYLTTIKHQNQNYIHIKKLITITKILAKFKTMIYDVLSWLGKL